MPAGTCKGSTTWHRRLGIAGLGAGGRHGGSRLATVRRGTAPRHLVLRHIAHCEEEQDVADSAADEADGSDEPPGVQRACEGGEAGERVMVDPWRNRNGPVRLPVSNLIALPASRSNRTHTLRSWHSLTVGPGLDLQQIVDPLPASHHQAGVMRGRGGQEEGQATVV